jgi:hypothetical protein
MSPWKEAMTYDTMSVHDLIGEAMYIGAEHLMVMKDLIPAFECAFRAAVIREASVGTVYVAREYADGCPEFGFKCPESMTGLVKDIHICKLCGELMPEREYALVPSNLIPKETP